MTHKIPFNACLWAILSLLVMLCSCGKPTPDEALAQADEAIARGDASEAIYCCIEIDEEKLSVNQLCRCALIYAKASQLGNNPEYMALASQCMKKAIKMQADSVASFISTLQYADMATLNEVYSLSKFNPDSIRIDNFPEYYEDPEMLKVNR